MRYLQRLGTTQRMEEWAYMAENEQVRQEVAREVNWYASLTLPSATTEVDVFARTESLKPHLLEECVLRIDTQIRVFAVVKNKEQNRGEIFSGNNNSSALISMPVFVRLPNLVAFEDILSVRHQIESTSATVRSGRVFASGLLNLNVIYHSAASLNGRVTEFQHKRPLRGSQLSLLNYDDKSVMATATTDNDGRYVFSDLKPGTYLVEVAAADYETEVQVAVVNFRDTVDFILHRKLND